MINDYAMATQSPVPYIAPLERFAFNDLFDDFFMGIHGRRGSGKTQFILNVITMLYETKKIDEVIIFTSVNSSMYANLSFVSTLYSAYRDDLFANVLDRFHKENGKHKCIIFDDPIFGRGNTFDSLVRLARCYGITIILASQYLQLTPTLRGQLTYFVLFGDESISNMKRIHDQYGMYQKFSDFIKIKDYYVHDYGMLILSFTPSPQINYYKCDHLIDTSTYPHLRQVPLNILDVNPISKALCDASGSGI